MPNMHRLKGWALIAVIGGQSILLLFGYYSFLFLELLEVDLPRFWSWGQLVLSPAGTYFLITYAALWKIFNLTRRLDDKRLLAYSSLALSLLGIVSSWNSAPRRTADRIYRERFEAALDLEYVLDQSRSIPEEWHESFYWTDQAQESSRKAATKLLAAEQKEWWKFSRIYDHLQYLRAKHDYYDAIAWTYENVDNVDPAIKAEIEGAERASLVINVILVLSATASGVLVVLSELAFRSEMRSIETVRRI